MKWKGDGNSATVVVDGLRRYSCFYFLLKNHGKKNRTTGAGMWTRVGFGRSWLSSAATQAKEEKRCSVIMWTVGIAWDIYHDIWIHRYITVILAEQRPRQLCPIRSIDLEKFRPYGRWRGWSTSETGKGPITSVILQTHWYLTSIEQDLETYL